MLLTKEQIGDAFNALAKEHGLILIGVVYPRSSVIRITDCPVPKRVVIIASQPDPCDYGVEAVAQVIRQAGDMLRATASSFEGQVPPKNPGESSPG